MTYKNAEIRMLINQLLTETEFTTLCFDYYQDVQNQFTAGMERSQREMLLIEYCQRRDRIPELLEHLKAANPEGYQKYTRQLDLKTINDSPRPFDPQEDQTGQGNPTQEPLQVEQVVDIREKMTREILDQHPVRAVPDLAGRNNIIFRDRDALRAMILLQTKANHIELYGPAGVGKTYFLQHLTTEKPWIRTVYIDLVKHSTPQAILGQAIGTLEPAMAGPEVTEEHFAQTVQRLYRPLKGDPTRHFIFIVDNASDKHQASIDWLVSQDGLINSQAFLGMLEVMGIRSDEIKLQVVVASRLPVIQPVYHPNFRLARYEIEPLDKNQEPENDPIRYNLVQLAKKAHIPISPETEDKLSEQIHYLSGGHPLCATNLLLAVRDRFFRVPDEQWVDLFKEFVFPVIYQELPKTLHNSDLVHTLRMLSVFRYFDQRLLGTLIEREILTKDPGVKEISRQARQLRIRLVDTFLVSEPGMGDPAYRINQAYRRVLSLDIEYSSPEIFIELNKTAILISLDRLRRGPLPAERAVATLIELIYHLMKAFELNPTDQPEMTARLKANLDDYLPLILQWIEELDRPTYLTQLKNSLRADEELRDTALRVSKDTHCFDALAAQVDQFVADHS